MTVRYGRLWKLARYMEKMSIHEFHFGTILSAVNKTKLNPCGTLACAMGLCPIVFPKLIQAIRHERVIIWKYKGKRIGEISAASIITSDIFGLRESSLFLPGIPSPADWSILLPSASPREVAERIRTFVAWHRRTYGMKG
jgi:hypothetical protein